MRHESRRTEQRAALVPEDARKLIARGVHLTVEESPQRVFPAHAYADAGCAIEQPGSWASHCPAADIVLGLKELPDEPSNLIYRHIFSATSTRGSRRHRGCYGASRQAAVLCSTSNTSSTPKAAELRPSATGRATQAPRSPFLSTGASRRRRSPPHPATNCADSWRSAGTWARPAPW
ncbi:hypothetical protein ACWDZ4_05160 [Streptomyces sp. NPDC003016]